MSAYTEGYQDGYEGYAENPNYEDLIEQRDYLEGFIDGENERVIRDSEEMDYYDSDDHQDNW